MLLTISLTLLNLLLALLETRIVRIQSLDIAPIGIVIAAQRGESVILAALLINAPYAALSPQKLRFLWVTLPLTLALGYLSLTIASPFLLALLYHTALALVAAVLGLFTSGYLLFAGVNLVSNLILVRFSLLFT